MTPKEKAKELIEIFKKPIDPLHKYPMCYETAKQCAIITVDEILDATKGMVCEEHGYSSDLYWQQVKQEIKNL